MKSRIRLALALYLLGLLCAFAVFALWVGPDGKALQAYAHFFPIGVFAAIIANSSAVGGDVVFVPFFTALSDLEARGAVTGIMSGGALTPFMTVGLSFLIQAEAALPHAVFVGILGLINGLRGPPAEASSA